MKTFDKQKVSEYVYNLLVKQGHIIDGKYYHNEAFNIALDKAKKQELCKDMI